MRVLFVYKYLTLGGVEAVLRTRLEELGRWGVDARAWFFGDHGGRAMFAGLEERVEVGDSATCMDAIRRGRYDLVSTIDSEEIFPAFLGGRPGFPRLVVETHSAYVANLDYLSRVRELRPAALWAPSRHHGDFVRRRLGGGMEVAVVPNPLRRIFLGEPAPCASPPPRPVVAWMGRLDDHKNWEGLLDLGGLLLARGRELEIWLVGQPVGAEAAAELLRQARRTGTLARLRWFRGLPHEAIPAFFDAVRDSGGAAVTTSRGESFGMTVAEAMARRCAVVVPDAGPFTELVEHGRSGLTYGPGAMEEAAAEVERLLASAALRDACGRQGRETVLARFAPEPALAVLAAQLCALAKRPAEAGGQE
jgi:glycosyltransferase involved in cell wall biosynthesis